jgi:hypothetical protein
MHQEQPMTYFLYRYESTSGLWVQMKLASQVSRPMLEAMNAILLKDGILAFIGTKSEFGLYETELKNLREVSSTGSWTSLPEATILATLGLCLNPSTAEGRSLVFHGSPRVLVLGWMIDMVRQDLGEWCVNKVYTHILNEVPIVLEVPMLKDLEVYNDQPITPNELRDLTGDVVQWYSTTTQNGLFKRVPNSGIMPLQYMSDQNGQLLNL